MYKQLSYEVTYCKVARDNSQQIHNSQVTFEIKDKLDYDNLTNEDIINAIREQLSDYYNPPKNIKLINIINLDKRDLI